ncbi:hypothetical protein, partial [Bradyrhizobium sp.]|uniref:hypothetical protein n=1 Tax=Bradyrhizobium sp. TaxID=376 RepID=UPI00290F3A6F
CSGIHVHSRSPVDVDSRDGPGHEVERVEIKAIDATERSTVSAERRRERAIIDGALSSDDQ